MESSLQARRDRVRVKPKLTGRLNGVEILMFGLIALALIDCTVIGLLVAHGFGN
jgi:hypothetical protein